MKNKILTGLLIVLFSFIQVQCKSDQSTNEYNNSGKDSITKIKDVEIPHIDYVSLAEVQSHETDTNVVWFDDFDQLKEYMDSSGNTDPIMFFGEKGASMKAGFTKGEIKGEGNRKVTFGDFPGSPPVLKKGRKFDEIYWRIYVKHEHGWEGAPAKMSRATSIVSENWKQAIIAHVWSGQDNSLTLDPARGVEDQSDRIKTTKYNDFNNLVWLGNKPSSEFKISSTKESGYWILVESRAKLNTPGKNDGINQLWIDGRLEAERKNLNFRGSYKKHGINAVFLESYWNTGSPKTQGRWFDNFVISTKPIGPVSCPGNPTLYKTPYYGPEKIESWEVEVASDYQGNDIVFYSNVLTKPEHVTITTKNGNFDGSLTGKNSLQPGIIYFTRVRQKSTTGNWSEWSRWHQGFLVQ
jgi:hypothetical protein